MAEELKRRTGGIHGRLWGDRARDWADLQEAQFRPLYEAVFARAGIGAGTRYLDVGCGAGYAVHMAAEAGAQVAGVDASANLLAIAKERTPSADLRQGDLEELPFGDGSFDVVTGFNSIQFAGNVIEALREARRVAKPGGKVVVLAWSEPERMEAARVVSALKPLMKPQPPGGPNAFALADEAHLRAVAVQAGLQPGEMFEIRSPWEYADLDIALRALQAIGVAARARETIGEDAVKTAFTGALAPFRKADGSYRFSANFRCLISST